MFCMAYFFTRSKLQNPVIMQKLIIVMTSRVPSGALKPSSKEEELLEGALDYINKWEAPTGPSKRGFLSPGTAEGLRVTESYTGSANLSVREGWLQVPPNVTTKPRCN